MKVVAAVLFVLVLIVAISPLRAQTSKPSFEAATVVPSSGEVRAQIINSRSSDGGFEAKWVTLNALIAYWYGIHDYQISGGPDWAETDKWDVQAQAAQLSPISVRVQSLLEDKFHLAFHRETRSVPAYNLVVANDGAKLTPTATSSASKPSSQMSRGADGGIELRATAIPLMNFVMFLSEAVDHPVMDLTGLSGRYDFHLQWTGQPEQMRPQLLTADPGTPILGGVLGGVARTASVQTFKPTGPSIITAIQEQLGLKLESATGPVEAFVIDHAEKPIPN